MIALPIILSSNGLASEIIFGQNLFITAIDTTGQPGDSIRIVYDSAGIPIDTIRNDSAQSKPLFDDLVKYDADDSVRFSIQEKKVYLYGNGFVKYLTTELRADYIELDMDKKLAMATGVPDSVGKLKGTPKFKDGGQEFESTELHYNFDTKKGYVTEIITQEGEGYIQGKTDIRCKRSERRGAAMASRYSGRRVSTIAAEKKRRKTVHTKVSGARRSTGKQKEVPLSSRERQRLDRKSVV